jgi:hypothetical protein
MKHDDKVALSNFSNEIASAQQVRSQLIDRLKASPVAQHLPTGLQFDEDGTIIVDCFGYKASAHPRIVVNGEGFGLIECRFLVQDPDDKEKDLELFRFYADSSGLYLEPLHNTLIVHLAGGTGPTEICGRVLLAAMHSKLFTPKAIA